MNSDLIESFKNDDAVLREKVEALHAERQSAGLDALTGGLAAVVVNVEPERRADAVAELLRYTGLAFNETFKDGSTITCLLTAPGSADFLVTSRLSGKNPFIPFNDHPKSSHLPNTRLETFIYTCTDLPAYLEIQKGRGLPFAGPMIETERYRYIQTPPSAYTGNALGFVEWRGEPGRWRHAGCWATAERHAKPDLPHLDNVKHLDHTAIRVRAEERDAAILEFMSYTSYDFQFAIYVDSLNSITNVARLTRGDYAQVFTSGIAPFKSLETSGPTEKFIHNYGTRVHHMAFHTENIEATFAALKADGLDFLIELVGSPEEGLKQTFSQPSPATLMVNEYIHRYGDFDGFFTKSNVTALTQATDQQ